MSARPTFPTRSRAAMMDMAPSAHRLLGCKGASRSDFRWDDEQGEAGLYLLEVNTQPGMTPLSLVPEQARHRASTTASWSSDDRGGAAMSAAHVRRGAVPARAKAAARPRARSRSEEDREAAAGRSGARQQVAGLVVRRLRAARSRVVVLIALDIPAKAERAAGEGGGRGRLHASAASRSSASTTWTAHRSTRSSSTRFTRSDQAARPRRRRRWSTSPRSATGCCASAGSRMRGCRVGCRTRSSSTSSSASRRRSGRTTSSWR